MRLFIHPVRICRITNVCDDALLTRVMNAVLHTRAALLTMFGHLLAIQELGLRIGDQRQPLFWG